MKIFKYLNIGFLKLYLRRAGVFARHLAKKIYRKLEQSEELRKLDLRESEFKEFITQQVKNLRIVSIIIYISIFAILASGLFYVLFSSFTALLLSVGLAFCLTLIFNTKLGEKRRIIQQLSKSIEQ